MMTASLLFWLALPLPGYALTRRFSSDDLRSGLMGTLAVSYFFTFGLLSPISILCYLTHAPVWIFSMALVLFFVGAVVEITRRKWWGQTGRMLLAGAGVELLIVAMDMALGARVGAFMAGDAFVHVSRIRSIVDHGFQNYDPFVAGQYFFPIYHTNLIHALYAACAQITRCEILAVWYDSLPWGKLLIYSGSYYLAWRVFENRWAAWVAAIFTVGVRGPFPYVIYPNQLSPYFLTPMMIGLAVEACRGPARWDSAIKLGLGSLILGQVHGLYALFCAAAIGPGLGLVAAWRMARRTPRGWRVGLCGAALAAGLPFLLVSKWKTPPMNIAAGGETAVINEGGYFVHARHGWVMRNPANLIDTLGGGPWNCLGWVAGIACAMAGRRRRQAAIVLGVAVTAVAIFYTPPICTFFLKRLGEEWVMQRFDYIWGVCHIALVPAAIAAVIDPGAAWPILRSAVSCIALPLGIASAGHVSPDDWESYVLDREHGAAKQRSEDRQGYVRVLWDIREFIRDIVPRGETILVDPQNGVGIVAMMGYHIVAPISAGNGVPDLLERRADLNVMLSPETPWEARAALLRKYHISYFYPTRPPVDWAQPHAERVWRGNRRAVIKFKAE